MEITDLAFNRHIGIKKSDKDVRLRKQPHLFNHVNSMHAAAIYGLAEAACGDYIIENLMAQFPDGLALVRQGSIKYKRPAVDDCYAQVDVSHSSLQTCIDTLKKRNRAIFTIPVRILCDETLIATAKFDWWFSLK